MTNQEIEQLVDKYLDGTASDSERAQLLDWYRGNLQEDTLWLSGNPKERQHVKERMKSKMRLGIRTKYHKPSQVRSIKRVGQIAAAVAVFLLISVWISYTFNPSTTKKELYVSHQASVDSTENRYVYLPDSSIVILRYGSSLELVSDFSKNTREVRLVGEGYFDVKRDKSRPFIVHAGEVKTVVLGTAFTIKALKDDADIQVTVQRGKVRVEKQENVIAELTANQQLDVDVKTKQTEQKTVRAEITSSWKATDLQFESKPFGELVYQLERRYNTPISFDSPDLANCPMTGTFIGTETLEEVLTTLCSVRNAKFRKMKDGTILIIGKGCLSNELTN